MNSFAVVRVTGDEIHTLRLCESQEAALAARRQFRELIPPKEGGVHVVFGRFDAEGKLLDRSFLLY